jgi:hypothetical protein
MEQITGETTMALLTTSKLIAVFNQFSTDCKRSLARLLDAVEANGTAQAKYEASCSSKGYAKVQEAMLDAALEASKGKTDKNGRFSREIDTLLAGDLALQQNKDYYLIKGFTSSVSESPFHIRFENPGQGEITDFHLTTEEGWTRVKTGEGLQAKGRFFFTIEDGVIAPQIVNKIRGQGVDQSSDMRLAPMVQDTMIYVYYIMYCLATI